MHKNSKRVYCIELDRSFDSLKIAEEKTGVSQSNISNCCRKRLKFAGRKYGLELHWEYIDESEDFEIWRKQFGD